MATKQYKITLTDEVADYLRAEDSRGRLSEGIDRLVHRTIHSPQATTMPRATHHTAKTFDLPDDETPEKVDGRIAKGNENRAKKEADTAKENLAKYSAGFRDICLDRFIGSIPEDHIPRYMESYSKHLAQDVMDTIYNEVMADEDGSGMKAKREFWAERKKHEEDQEAGELNYKLKMALEGHDTPPVQTLKLTEKARKAVGLFGTPETMTDEQIKETNEYYADWESRPDAGNYNDAEVPE